MNINEAQHSFDKTLLDRTCTQWQIGDWSSLASIEHASLQHHPERAKLALLAAVGHLQLGQNMEGRQFVRLAQDWGIDKRVCAQILVGGVHNSLARAAAIGNQQHHALQHFENTVQIDIPGVDTKLLIQARAREQLSQLGLASRGDYERMGAGWTASKHEGLLLSPEILEKPANERYANFSSGQYWEKRYQKGETSGYGSYGRLAEFKAKIINKFIEDEGVERVIEFGCGDGNQLSMLRVKSYVGVDVSSTIIDKCKDRFKGDASKLFLTNDEYLKNPLKGELSLSLDVIFHLVEDDVFERYMNMLFCASTKYCIIYASNSSTMIDSAIHVRHRKFTDWIKNNINYWRLAEIIHNKYPHNGEINPKNHSFSDFYFYKLS